MSSRPWVSSSASVNSVCGTLSSVSVKSPAVSAKDALSADGSSESGVSVRSKRNVPSSGVVPSSRPYPVDDRSDRVDNAGDHCDRRLGKATDDAHAQVNQPANYLNSDIENSGVGQVVAGVDHAHRRVDEGAGHRNGSIDDRATRVRSGRFDKTPGVLRDDVRGLLRCPVGLEDAEVVLRVRVAGQEVAGRICTRALRVFRRR